MPLEGIEEIIKEISKQAGKGEDEIKKLVKEKQEELSGLVSAEGAAYIVGRELGASLIKEGRKELKIKNLVSGLRSADLTAKIVRIFEPKEWQKKDKKGKVQSIILGDETGTIRLSLWNDEVGKYKINDGDVVKIKGAYVKEGFNDNLDISIGRGTLEKTDDKIEVSENFQIQNTNTAKRTTLDEAKEGMFGEFRASLVQMFARKPFFEICPTCETKVEENDGKRTCSDHGVVEPKIRLIVSGVMDDGYNNIRAVFFAESAEKIIGKSTEEVKNSFNETEIEKFYESLQSLGKDFIVKGRIKINTFSEKPELMVNSVEDINLKAECEKLIGDLGG
ncbi:MAG: hypothetical protein ISS36_03885 [Candidatus Aenigmarchaeota archaeon]|nr:hypothetical protein [Candidatus Aenigmarchaeota archaeon]